MPIVVNHRGEVVDPLVEAVASANLANFRQRRADRQQALDLQDRQFNEGVRRFNVEQDFRQQQAAADQMNRLAAMGMQGQQLGAQMLDRQQAREASLAAAAMGRDADIAQAQIDAEAEYAKTRAGRMQIADQWAGQSIAEVEDFIDADMKEARKMNLDPEGKRTLGQLEQSLKNIRASRNQWMPQEYAQLLGDFYRNYADAALENRQAKEITGVDIFQENTIDLPSGQRIYINPKNGRAQVIDPWEPKEKKQAVEADAFKRPTRSEFYRARQQALAEIQAEHPPTYSEDGNPASPYLPSQEEIAERVAAMEAGYTTAHGGGVASADHAQTARGQFVGELQSPEEADELLEGDTFTYGGVLYEKIGDDLYNEVKQ